MQLEFKGISPTYKYQVITAQGTVLQYRRDDSDEGNWEHLEADVWTPVYLPDRDTLEACHQKAMTKFTHGDLFERLETIFEG
jgi:hypothetical protein